MSSAIFKHNLLTLGSPKLLFLGSSQFGVQGSRNLKGIKQTNPQPPGSISESESAPSPGRWENKDPESRDTKHSPMEEEGPQKQQGGDTVGDEPHH